jgi:predicted MFS family arabinose efflux permease
LTQRPEISETEPERRPIDDTRATVAGTALSVVGFATFLLMPQFIEAAVADLRYTEQQVGILSSAVMVGSTFAAVAASLWIRRSSWRLVASIALIGLLVANGASMVAHGFAAFVALQGIGGFCGGSLYSLSLTVLSDGRRPDRYFAYAIGAQTVYQIFGLVAGPFLIHHGGVNAMLALFVALCVVGLRLVRYVPVHGRIQGVATSGSGLLSRPVLFALAGCFLFYVNIGAYWTYIERIGTTAGIGLEAISNGLAFSTAASMAGVFLASWLGGRRGFFMPMAASAVAIVLAVVLLAGNLRLTAYVVSAVVYGVAWNVSVTYQYSTVNIVDRSRRGVALAPAFHNAGGAAGPAVAALFVTEHDHSGVLWLVSMSVLASVVCFLISLRLRARAARVPGLRPVLLSICVALGASALPRVTAADDPSGPLEGRLDTGRVLGRAVGKEELARSWLGIPYAAAPVGGLIDGPALLEALWPSPDLSPEQKCAVFLDDTMYPAYPLKDLAAHHCPY